MSNPDGSVTEPRQGLFDHDTRVLSRYRILLDGMQPRLDTAGLLDAAHWIARATVPGRAVTRTGLSFLRTLSN
ncbi:MAG: hypothetical protein EHM13_15235 [Acidobacteria bacterium]|nr:MAG: hypothetical protein EHM13_15235 [Acidobacteriota bacterium]